MDDQRYEDIMRRTSLTLTGLLIACLAIAPFAARPRAQGNVGSAPPVITSPATGLTIAYSAGTVYTGGKSNAITAGTLTATTTETNCAAPLYSSCNIVYYASGTGLSITTSAATAFTPGNVVLAFIVTNSSGNVTNTYVVSKNLARPFTENTDGVFIVSPTQCGFTLATTAEASGWPTLISPASGQLVYEAKTNNTAGTIQVDCLIHVPSQLTTGWGVTINNIQLLYGVVTTSMASIAAATVNSTSYPTTPGGSAAGTVSTTAGGTLTVTPSSLQTTAVTAGLLYNEQLALGTPIVVNTDDQIFDLRQVFTTAGTSATILDIGGVVVHYSLLR